MNKIPIFTKAVVAFQDGILLLQMDNPTGTSAQMRVYSYVFDFYRRLLIDLVLHYIY